MLGLVALSLLAACGSDGGVSQPEDEFLDTVEAECRTAQKEVDKLDFSGSNAGSVDDYIEIVSGLVDTFEDLEAPQDLAKDFKNLTDRLDDQTSGAETLSSAIEAGDTAAVDAENSKMFDLATETDESAKALGALRCRLLAPTDGFVGSTSSPDDTIPSETVPVDTTPVTDPPDTTVDTTPIDTTGDTTPEPVYPADLDAFAVAPAGYTWVADYQQTDIGNLYTSSLGPIVVDYSAGQVENIEDQHTASIYVMTVSEEWTSETSDRYLTWEVVVDGEDLVTPAGYPVRRMTLAFPDTDCLAYYAGTKGIAICTYTGIDGMPILDAFLAANPG